MRRNIGSGKLTSTCNTTFGLVTFHLPKGLNFGFITYWNFNVRMCKLLKVGVG